jgi:hypothetical protein
MRASSWKTAALSVLASVTILIAGCGRREVNVPAHPPATGEIKGWSDSQIAAVEKAIQEKDSKLPGRVRGLIRHLRSLEINVTIGPGQKFQNTEEVLTALRGAIAKLDGWCEQSLTRDAGDSDQDRAELQAILNETKEILKGVRADKPGGQ